jgi:hypothetical protein
MTQSLNIPIPASAYRQPKLVLKNRRSRRNRIQAKPELSLVNNAQALTPPPVALPTLPHTQPVLANSSIDLPEHSKNHLSQAVLLDWLGSQPVAFHRIYVDICGSVNAAVWLSLVLSLLDGKGKELVDAHSTFRFPLSSVFCEAHTGLTDAEQRKAQRALVTNGLLKSSPKRSGSAGMTFELDLNLLTQRLLTHSEGLAALIQTNSDAEPKLNVLDLERRAQARASNRNATGRRA